MILHTVISPEFVMSVQPDLTEQTKLKQINGGFVECRRSGDGYCVSRLIATDPAMYLNPEYFPGSTITLH